MTWQAADKGIEDAARDWHARRLGGLSAMEAERLQAWLEAAPEHAQALAAVDALWADLGWDETLNAEALERQARRDAPARKRAWSLPRPAVWLAGGGAAIAACLALVVMLALPGELLGPAGPTGRTEVFETAIGEIREIELADGSRATLGGHTTIRVDFGRAGRQVSLVSGGDVLFDVARDESRPFTVRAGTLSARVLGTVFEVNRSPGVTTVSVVEGQVRVSAPQGESAVLAAGDRIVAEAGDDWDRERFDPGQAARWIETRMAYSDAPLSDIVDDINRYHPGGLSLASADLGDLRVTSSFRVDQMETALSGIAISHGLELHRTASGGFVLRRADAAE